MGLLDGKVPWSPAARPGSDRASYVNGQAIVVDGGQSAA